MGYKPNKVKPPNGGDLWFIFEQEDGSRITVRVHAEDSGESSSQLGTQWGIRTEESPRFDSAKLVLWLEECAKELQIQWGLPFPIGWHLMQDGIHNLVKRVQKDEGFD